MDKKTESRVRGIQKSLTEAIGQLLDANSRAAALYSDFEDGKVKLSPSEAKEARALAVLSLKIRLAAWRADGRIPPKRGAPLERGVKKWGPYKHELFFTDTK
jgi:hypothetical protein